MAGPLCIYLYYSNHYNTFVLLEHKNIKNRKLIYIGIFEYLDFSYIFKELYI